MQIFKANIPKGRRFKKDERFQLKMFLTLRKHVFMTIQFPSLLPVIPCDAPRA